MGKANAKKTGKIVVPNLTNVGHPVQEHVEAIRDLVHAELADRGISNLVLNEMRFGAVGDDSCPEGQHQKMVCRTLPNGTSVCRLECVPD